MKDRASEQVVPSGCAGGDGQPNEQGQQAKAYLAELDYALALKAVRDSPSEQGQNQ